MQEIFTQNQWKLAAVLILVGLGAVVWSYNTTSTQATLAEPTRAGRPTLAVATPIPEFQPAQNLAGMLPTATATRPPPTETTTPIPVFYVVEAGDVPLAIAAQYDINVESLLTLNKITDPTSLQIGQELRIPVTVTPTPTVSPTPRFSPTPTPEPVYYVIKAGDTLLQIAIEFETNMDLIMLANHITNPHALQIGQELLIPPNTLDFDGPTIVHLITSGDTLSHLSFFYGSTIDDILAVNPGLEPRALKIGTQIIIPVTSSPINPNANPRLPQVTIPDAPLPKMAALQAAMVSAINAEREVRGLRPYKEDAQLDLAALAHAQDMIARGYFAHTTPEGVTLEDRYAQHNIEVLWSGENIQRNVKPKETTVAEAIRWFMNSATHRANILHDRYSHLGVGVAEGPTGWYTYVLNFAER